MENKPGRFTASNGECFFYQSWVPEQSPELVIVLVHGFSGHSGRFENTE